MLLSILNYYGSSRRNYDPFDGAAAAGVEVLLGIIVAIVLTILLYVLVFPEKRKYTLNSFFLFVKNFFDIKYLIIEKILKFFYVLNTMLAICIGFFLLFGRTFLAGLLIMILGPVVQRLVYESAMLGILLVKNTMEINNKLDEKEGTSTTFDGGLDALKIKKPAGFNAYQQAPQAFAQPEMPQAYAQPETPQMQYQQEQPGTPSVCPSCGAPIAEGTIFCASCGAKVK